MEKQYRRRMDIFNPRKYDIFEDTYQRIRISYLIWKETRKASKLEEKLMK